MLFRAAVTVVAGRELGGGGVGDTYVYFSLHSPTEQSGGKIVISFVRLESRAGTHSLGSSRLRSLVQQR